jgi:hypothetical protein
MAALLALRFLAELGMLTCLAIGGWRVGDSTLTSVVIAVLLPLAAASIWGWWVAPRAAHRLRDPARLAVEVTLFAAAFVVSLAGAKFLAIAVWVAFLISIPSRGHEAALSPGSG